MNLHFPCVVHGTLSFTFTLLIYDVYIQGLSENISEALHSYAG